MDWKYLIAGGLRRSPGFPGQGVASLARVIYGCALDPQSVDGISGHAGKRNRSTTPPMLSSGTPDDAQTWGSLGVTPSGKARGQRTQ